MYSCGLNSQEHLLIAIIKHTVMWALFLKSLDRSSHHIYGNTNNVSKYNIQVADVYGAKVLRLIL